jgi:CBS domain-containing protein
MTRDVQVARPDDSIQAVAQQMAQLDVGVMPVCDGQRIQGMVTDRDIAIRGVAQGLSADQPIRQVMTGNLEYVMANDDLDEVHDRMSAAQVRRLAVVDESGQLVGIVALGDVAREDKNKEAGETLEEISEPSSFAPR